MLLDCSRGRGTCTQYGQQCLSGQQCRLQLISVCNTIANSNYLEKSMCLGDLPLARHTQDRKEHDHRAAPRCEPEWTSSTEIISNKRTPQHGSAPKPRLRPCQSVCFVGEGASCQKSPTETTAEVVNPVVTLRLAVMNLCDVSV